jgi:hypothetical protein
MKASRHGSRKQKFPREEVHLDLSPLLAAVIDDPVKANRRSFGRTRGVDLARWRRVRVVVTQVGMTDFMRDKKRTFEGRARIFVKDEIVARNKHRAASVKDGRAVCGNFDIKPSPLCFGRCKRIRLPGIVPVSNGLRMQPRGGLSCEFDCVHLSLNQPEAERV